MRTVGVSKTTVRRWQDYFVEAGVAGEDSPPTSLALWAKAFVASTVPAATAASVLKGFRYFFAVHLFCRRGISGGAKIASSDI
jgi:hypothetical protein